MKLGVMQLETQNKMNFPPEYIITDQSKLKRGGGGGLLTFLLWKGGGVGLVRGGLKEDLQYSYTGP